MNIFLKELKFQRKSLVLWCLGVILMIIAGMAKFDAYSAQGQSINELIGDIPKSIRIVLGFGEVDVSTVAGYYTILYIYMLLMAAIHAAMLGAAIIAKEERDKTYEFLLVKPVSRNTVVTAKLAAALTNIVIYNVVNLVSFIVILGGYNNEGADMNGKIVLTLVGMFILQVLFMVLGSALAAVKRKAKSAASLAAAIMLLTYMLSVAIDLNEGLKVLKYATPFKYFEAKYLMFGSGLDVGYILLSAVLITALTIITYKAYSKKDLQSH
ncbi:ABC transporter permease subunit [Bacillus benzoevorans]|uniref:ABC-2 type transport system permease protein n=1 Tax=Bacillus benzoevorans TaxID=1456 RepID=A0A7X0LY95_9BACI|nr:ABC transporter permease subunit [Bacillus benzoevorans]MBB6447224.1 ABC-2 type transport system permease protein [Bacillus benzoevorans]